MKKIYKNLSKKDYKKLISLNSKLNYKKKKTIYVLKKYTKSFYYIDIGASLPLSKIANFFNKKNLILSEPHQNESHKLKKKFPYARIIQSVISYKSKVNFYHYERNNFNCLYPLDQKNIFSERFPKFVKKEKVKSKKIRNLFSRNKTKKMFLKIDTQCAMDVLKSCDNNLLFPIILTEIDEVSFYKNNLNNLNINSFLQKKGYFKVGTVAEFYRSINERYVQNAFGNEIEYTSDALFIKINKDFKYELGKLVLIIMFCLNFNFLDFAKFILTKNRDNINKNLYDTLDESIKIIENINKNIIKNNLMYIYKEKKFILTKDLINFKSEFMCSNFCNY